MVKACALSKVRHFREEVVRDEHVGGLQVAVKQRVAALFVVEVLEASGLRWHCANGSLGYKSTENRKRHSTLLRYMGIQIIYM